jgi:hypothetical protein
MTMKYTFDLPDEPYVALMNMPELPKEKCRAKRLLLAGIFGSEMEDETFVIVFTAAL